VQELFKKNSLGFGDIVGLSVGKNDGDTVGSPVGPGVGDLDGVTPTGLLS
jgi:hypothetical protein